ncbi:hypothetical protein Taro_056490 [Colocasia esculenta]|uniref:Uncharacterized protein n=1 Tax=Colocasia esculenta TaxID=4460 RepID=A0A843XVX7_COLES|nr:hypothetical protein [Colocasia esculenta]
MDNRRFKNFQHGTYSSPPREDNPVRKLPQSDSPDKNSRIRIKNRNLQMAFHCQPKAIMDSPSLSHKTVPSPIEVGKAKHKIAIGISEAAATTARTRVAFTCSININTIVFHWGGRYKSHGWHACKVRISPMCRRYGELIKRHTLDANGAQHLDLGRYKLRGRLACRVRISPMRGRFGKDNFFLSIIHSAGYTIAGAEGQEQSSRRALAPPGRGQL